MSTPEQNDDFKFDLLTSGPAKNYAARIGIVAAAIAIIFIIATMTTNIASSLLPMNDDYLNALVPTGADGGEPVSLRRLEHQSSDLTLTVTGEIGNRTEYPLSDIIAVVEMQDKFGLPQTLEAPVDPPEIPVEGAAVFTATATLPNGIGGYAVRFKIADGPFVPHKDDRAATYALPGK